MNFSPYPNDIPLLEQTAKDKGYSVACLVRELVGNWCADRRAEKRLVMPAQHYTQRVVDDFADVE